MAEVPGVEVVKEEAVEVVVKVKEVRDKARVKEVRRDQGQVKGGPTSRRALITLHQGSVKNIMSMGSLHTGVRSQPLVHGRTSGSLRVNNETMTNLILMTYKTLCIKASTGKYTLHLI